MRGDRLFVSVACLAAALPLVVGSGVPAEVPVGPWPEQLCGVRLEPLPPTVGDRTFEQSAPIEVARFAHGEAHLVVRRLPAAAPGLHSLRECFRGVGREVVPLGVVDGPCGTRASAFEVRGGERDLTVHEWIVDDDGRVEIDFARFFWRASTGGMRPPFTAFARVAP